MFAFRRFGGSGRCSVIACAVLVLGSCLGGCSSNSPDYNNERTFGTPDAAVVTLAAAAKTGDVAELEAIFGPDGRQILSSGDPVADQSAREVFAVAINDRWSLREIDAETRELIIGYEDWPFPIPLVKDGRGWWFNTLAGKQEMLARRVGRNELAAIGTLRTYVIAQREYAGESRDGRPAGTYAQKIRSDPGRHDGLYWELTSPGATPSPLAQLAATSTAEGYSPEPPKGLRAYRGYFFRILTRQGPDAPGGAMDYVVNGEMTGGFAMIAFPAQYGNSGVMTFLVGSDGRVYEADLGEETPTIAGAMQDYNPHDGWKLVD